MTKFAEFVKLRRRVDLLRVACQEEKQSIRQSECCLISFLEAICTALLLTCTEKDEYHMLKGGNEKREGRLHRVQQTDFSQKLRKAQVGII